MTDTPTMTGAPWTVEPGAINFIDEPFTTGYTLEEAYALLSGRSSDAMKLEPIVAAADVHDGAMIALVPAAEYAQRFVIEGYEPLDQLHTTMLFLGPAANYPSEVQLALVERLREMFATQPAVYADVFGYSVWNPDGEKCLVANVTGSDIEDMHDSVEEFWEETGIEAPEQHEPWTPHMTIAYASDAEQLLVDTAHNVGPIVYDRVRIAFGGVNYDVPLWDAGGEDMTASDAFHLAGKHNQATHGRGGGGELERVDGKKLKKAREAHAAGVKKSKTGDAAAGAVPGEAPTSARFVGDPTSDRPPGFRDVNGGLREAHGDVDAVTLGAQSSGAYGSNEELRGAIRSMDTAMEGSHTTSDIVVSRIVRDPLPMFGGSVTKGVDNSGVTWVSHGFTSTTTGAGNTIIQQRERLHLGAEAVHYGGAQGMRMNIHAPAGTHAVRGSHDEGEIIIDRGSTFRIINDYGTVTSGPDEGLWVIDVEVVAQ